MTDRNPYKIKICGMRDPRNIAQVLDFKPDYLGFIFYEKSSRYVSEEQMKEIIKLNFAETDRVGVFVNESVENILKYADQGFFDIVQLHGQEGPEVISALKTEGLEVIKVFSVDDQFDASILSEFQEADYFLFDTKGKLPGGNGSKFNWDVLKKESINKPFFLSGGLSPSDLEQIRDWDEEQLYALDFNSKLEDEPALKNLEKVSEVLSR